MSNATGGKVRVDFETRGVEGVGKATDQVVGKIGNASKQIANGIASIATTADISALSLKGIAQQVSSIAFGFGAGGAFVGSIATVGLALYDHVTKPLKEAQQEAANLQKSLIDLARSQSLTGAAEKATTLYSGDRFARQVRTDDVKKVPADLSGTAIRELYGLEGLEKEQKRLGDILWGKSGQLSARVHAEISARKDEIDALVTSTKGEYRATLEIVTALAAKEGERAKTAAKIAADVKAAKAGTPSQKGTNLLFERLPLPKDLTQDRALSDLLNSAAVDRQIKPATIAPTAMQGMTDDALKGIKTMADQVHGALANGLGDAIASGFDAAFSGKGIAGAVGDFAGAALRVIGGVFKQIGTQALIGLKFLETIRQAIIAHPALGIPAAIGLIALGSALQSTGSGAGAARGASYSVAASGGYGGAGSITAPIIVNPTSSVTPSVPNPAAGLRSEDITSITPKAPIVVTGNYFLGTNDPSFQRHLVETFEKASKRRV
jgi:hypothetical protein